MQKSAKKRKRHDAEIDAALKNERASACRQKPLIRQPSSPSHRALGATLGTLSRIWPSVK